MRPVSLSRSVALPFVVAAVILAAVGEVSAQAWTPPKKHGSFALVYVRGFADQHLYSQTVTLRRTRETCTSCDQGDMFANTSYLRLDYGITDRLAVNGDVAYVSTKYEGIFLGENPELDDGTYHGTFQDVRAELRYMAVQTEAFALTPFAGVATPTTDYETIGHSAPGKGLTQFPVGFNLGYVWPRYIHTTYVLGRYSYSFMRHEEHRLNRSDAGAEMGTYVTPWFAVRGLVGWQRTHGGIDWATDITSQEAFHDHDQFASSRFWSAGVGVSFDLGRSAAISASYSQVLSGANTIDTGAFGVSTSWYFGGAPSATLGGARQAPPQVATLGKGDLIR